MQRLRRSQDEGFTLLEMSIVLVIIATILAGGIVMFAESTQTRALKDTQRKLADIQKALYNFRMANDRLPCPADVTLAMGTTTASNNNFGVEASTLGDCFSTGTLKANFQQKVSSTGNTHYASVTGSTASSAVITNISPNTTTSGISRGMTVTGSGIPAGDTVSSVDGASQVTITPSPATATATGVSLTFTSTVVDNIADTSNMKKYQAITGTGIPNGDTIASVDSGTQITLATAATAAGTGVTLVTLDNVEGMVPTKALRLPDEDAIDGWGRRIMYVVDARLTASNAFDNVPLTDGAGVTTTCTTTATCTPPSITGAASRMQINDASGNVKATGAAYVLVSFGPDGFGAWPRGGGTNNLSLATSRIDTLSTNTDQKNNCDCSNSGGNIAANATAPDGIFVQKMATQDPATANHTNDFDDVVVYATRKDLASLTETGGAQ